MEYAIFDAILFTLLGVIVLCLSAIAVLSACAAVRIKRQFNLTWLGRTKR